MQNLLELFIVQSFLANPARLRTFSPCIILLFILCMPACQTLNPQGNDNQNQEELSQTQKNLIVNYINQGQPNMALKELRDLIAKYPKDADYRNLMGLTYLSLQNPKMAIRFFEESYALAPRAAVALNLSSALIETKQFAKAMKRLKELRNSPAGRDYQYPERILHNIALCAERLQKIKLAEKYYRSALDLNPYYYLSLMRLGQLYESQKNSKLALDQFTKAREACLRCFDPIQALYYHLRLQGDPEKAQAILQEFLADKDIEAADRLKARQLQMSSKDQENKQKNQAMRPSRLKEPLRTN